MKIDKIALYNFSSFEGFNEFDFSIEDDSKNIILIGGKNGAGKTSLFSAIKIALYGPLAFGYLGANPRYISKIKDFINSRTFQTDKVESWVRVTISLMVEREIKEYEVTRGWAYDSQRLAEKYCVKLDGKLLDEQELSYFQNYLQSLIPPDLFELFLFDGEAVGSIFSTSVYNSYIKNAVYTLCGLDIYEIIRKYTHGYAGKASTEDEKKILDEYERLKEAVDDTAELKGKISAEIDREKEELSQLDTELLELETAFKKAGGISAAERERMVQEYEKAERVKNESAAGMKSFMEGIMPFYIVRDFNDKISAQLECEEKGEIFHYIREKLNREEILAALKADVSDRAVDTLLNMLLEKFKPEGFSEEAVPVYSLSREEQGRVNAMISTLRNFDAEGLIRSIRQKQQASDTAMRINRIFKNAMADEDAAVFAEKENQILKKKGELNQKIYEKTTALEQISDRLEILEKQKERTWQRVKENVRNRHVFELSNGLTNMMDALLVSKTAEIKKNLENLIIDNLQRIYRKNNLITHIEIDDSFQFNLYQDAVYTAEQLLHLMKNLGKQSVAEAVGKKGQEILFKKYEVNTLSSLQKMLMLNTDDTFELYQKIDLNRLSKGERQIFILSLYWAIIELSGQDIPFIIDTPYARIDANHRKEISEKFFPNISKQVVILSTDEEINEEYYRIIKPYVAREYLLMNDENQNRTSVEERYFFEV